MICECFNMNGKDPSEQKVGLLDYHNLMAFFVDPFANDQRGKFELKTGNDELVLEIISLHIPFDQNGSLTSQNRIVKEFEVSNFEFFGRCQIVYSQSCILQLFDTQYAEQMHVFEEHLVNVPSADQLKENNKQFLVAEVKH